MTDYADLLKELRICAQGQCGQCRYVDEETIWCKDMYLSKAIEAIEALQKEYQALRNTVISGALQQ